MDRKPSKGGSLTLHSLAGGGLGEFPPDEDKFSLVVEWPMVKWKDERIVVFYIISEVQSGVKFEDWWRSFECLYTACC